MNNEQQSPLGEAGGTTRKGDAFVRYYFIDRGREENLPLPEALDDFEKYIYTPIAQHVMTEYVNEASILAMEAAFGDDLPDAPSEEQALQVAQSIGLAVLHTFQQINTDANE